VIVVAMRADSLRDSRVTAVLGPTNTGKTHFAVERMLGHDSGIIGLPLRLLAREVYDRIAALRGKTRVALITGEEKITPERPAYWVCTVEAMPLDRPASFLAVDEIQLAADPDRGHVFTDRLLRARGSQETVFLGSDTIRPLLRHLLPRAEIVGRPRFSTLRHTGQRKQSRLPARTAVIAYTAEEVYAIAELLRRQHGGAAVVMGALSPRTRNAQVAMFEAGEVDYLVATDAIGMGLNLNIAHVAFARLEKFDGSHFRALTPQEIGQVAGRAGRYLNDGTFGTTGEVAEIDPESVERVEQHRFDALRRLQYRNSDLEFASIPDLIRSLEQPSYDQVLVRGREAEDLFALRTLCRLDEVRRAVRGPSEVRLLWDVCRIPDFRKTLIDIHVRLLGRIFRHLVGPTRTIPAEWLARQIDPLDRTEGDLDTLQRRLADIRTWTYISHQAAWLDEPARWQQRTREVEDRLSDALHERLTQRFVDRRTSALTRRLRDNGELAAVIEDDGAVSVEGHVVGHLDGFRFVAERGPSDLARRTLRGAADRVLDREIAARAYALGEARDEDITIDERHGLRWRGAPVGRAIRGADPLAPSIRTLDSAHLHGRSLQVVRSRLQRWLDDRVRVNLSPLLDLRDAGFSGPPGGIAFRLVEGLGSAPRSDVADLLAGLNIAARRALRATGVRFGRHYVYLPRMMKPERGTWAIRLRALAREHPMPDCDSLGRVSFVPASRLEDELWPAAGYRRYGERLIRVDMIERLADALHRRSESGPFPCSPELFSLVGCRRDEFPTLVRSLGFRSVGTILGGEPLFAPSARKRRRHAGDASRRKVDPNSPFAALGTLRRRKNRP
jgi:ATP-dependent RNA helicase SUPV3L1/SUV3